MYVLFEIIFKVIKNITFLFKCDPTYNQIMWLSSNGISSVIYGVIGDLPKRSGIVVSVNWYTVVGCQSILLSIIVYYGFNLL